MSCNNRDCTLAQCVFNWNTLVTGHRQERVVFPQQKNCQGQLQSVQSVSVHDSTKHDYHHQAGHRKEKTNVYTAVLGLRSKT
jgi:hypothetical protein